MHWSMQHTMSHESLMMHQTFKILTAMEEFSDIWHEISIPGSGCVHEQQVARLAYSLSCDDFVLPRVTLGTQQQQLSCSHTNGDVD